MAEVEAAHAEGGSNEELAQSSRVVSLARVRSYGLTGKKADELSTAVRAPADLDSHTHAEATLVGAMPR